MPSPFQCPPPPMLSWRNRRLLVRLAGDAEEEAAASKKTKDSAADEAGAASKKAKDKAASSTSQMGRQCNALLWLRPTAQHILQLLSSPSTRERVHNLQQFRDFRITTTVLVDADKNEYILSKSSSQTQLQIDQYPLPPSLARSPSLPGAHHAHAYTRAQALVAGPRSASGTSGHAGAPPRCRLLTPPPPPPPPAPRVRRWRPRLVPCWPA